MNKSGLSRGTLSRKDTAFYISLIILIVFEICSLNFLRVHFDLLLDSDMAGEMILSKLVYEQKKIVPDDWYYSTEVRILNTELVFAPLFAVFKSWHRIRLVGTSILHLMTILGSFALCRSVDRTKCFPFVALGILLPLSEDYYYFTLKGSYYIPCILICLFALTLAISFSRTSKKLPSFLYFTLSVILSFLSCLSGPRQMLLLYLPLFLTGLTVFSYERALLRKTDKKGFPLRLFALSSACLLASGLGYHINQSYFIEKYSLTAYSFDFKVFSWDDFISSVRGFLGTWGYIAGPFDLYRTVSNAGALIIFALSAFSVFYFIKEHKRVPLWEFCLSVFVFSSFWVFVLFYSFADTLYQARYNQQIAVLAFVMIALLFARCCSKASSAEFFIPAGLLTALLILSGALTLYTFKVSYMPVARNTVEAANLLEEEGYRAGFAEFWHADVVTELTDGQVDMYCFGSFMSYDEMSSVKGIMTTHKWLQQKSHAGNPPYEGKVCIILTEDEYNCCIWKEYLTDDYLIYAGGELRVFGFESYKDMIDVIGSYSCDYFDDNYRQGADDEDGIRLIHPTGLSCGPYITFYEGTYDVTVEGEGLENASIDCTGFSGLQHVPFTILHSSSERIVLRMTCDYDYYDGEIVITNEDSSEDVRLSLLTVDYRPEL